VIPAQPVVWRPIPLRATQVFLVLATFAGMAYSGGTYWDVAPHVLDDPSLLPRSVADLVLRCRAGVPFALWLFAILGAHEMGHYIACRRYRIAATWPYFLPAPLFLFGTFGAVIRIRAPIPDRRALFDVAVAGPLAGFVVAVTALTVGISVAVAAPADLVAQGGYAYSLPWIGGWIAEALRPGETLTMNGTLAAAWAGFLITVLNLFPAGQLDGGHIAYAVSRSFHRWMSMGAIALAAGTVIYAVKDGQPPAYMLWLAVLLWMRNRHPPLWMEHPSLGRGRLGLAALALLIFVLCFTWLPVRFLD
jgi:membrane-associated protease RseP (regulator of RpoE activity)